MFVLSFFFGESVVRQSAFDINRPLGVNLTPNTQATPNELVHG